MFEISWSELLILGIVTLIFVGPKELPVFLRTLGRYAGSIKRQANEFRAQFEEALREAELDSVKKEFEGLQASVNAEVMGAKQALNDAAIPPPPPPPEKIAAPAPEAMTALPVEPTLPMPPMPAPPSMER
jgi:sec-independent protein translocase protein TatB